MECWEDWDENPNGGGVQTEYAPQEQSEGKILGSRGRGFLPPSSNSNTYKVGKWPPKSENGRNENGSHYRENGGTRNGKDNWERSGNGGTRNGKDNWERSGNGGTKNGKDSWERSGNGREDNWLGNGRDKRESRDDEGGLKPKPKSTYVPEAPTEDENEIFGNGISSGINFSKYDDIEVKVSGENPPWPINSFDEAGLRSLLLDLIKKCNYSKPTPIQKYSIPIIMAGRDMMACAQTGSGKTAAFLIPIIHTLLEKRRETTPGAACRPQAVIVSPTRELTIQIFNEARKFSRGSVLKVCISYGGTAVFHQVQDLMKGCDILVATPGRLIDFLKRGNIELSEVKFIVLDEADRMLDMGFLPDMETLLTHSTMVSGAERQTLMFSATFPEEIQRLAGKFLNDYLFVTVGIVGGACSDVEQRFYLVSKFDKRNKLMELLTEMGSAKTLVFVEQKRTTDFIATFLCEKNFPATSIHGDREQREREEALRDFKRGNMDILVATSVAARGLDIKNVAHVVNFDLPGSVDEYVHRIGRTGRVGNRGLATSFYDPERDGPIASDLVKILKQAGQEVPDFLKDQYSGGSFGGPSKFGGNDVRNRQKPVASGIGEARPEVFEEEVW